MSVESFLDTSIFVYLFDETAPSKRERSERLVQRALKRHNGCISFQVVQETVNVLTGKLKVPPETVRQLLNRILMPLCRVFPTRVLYQSALDLQARYRIGFYDSLIVAAAIDMGCRTLYSEDLQHGQQISGVVITNPFR